MSDRLVAKWVLTPFRLTVTTFLSVAIAAANVSAIATRSIVTTSVLRLVRIISQLMAFASLRTTRKAIILFSSLE